MKDVKDKNNSHFNGNGMKKAPMLLAVLTGAVGLGVASTASEFIASAADGTFLNTVDTITGINPDKAIRVNTESDNVTISGKQYPFIAQWTAKTEVVPIPANGVWKKVQVEQQSGNASSAAGTDVWQIVDPDEDTWANKELGMMYKNVGTYKGRNVNLHIKLLKWTPYFTKTNQRLITFQAKKGIVHRTMGYERVTQSWNYEYDDGTKVNFKDGGMYFSFLDLDANQYLQFGESTSAKIERILVTDDSKVKFEKAGSQLRVGAINSPSANDDNKDPDYMATMFFEGLSTIVFSWVKDYAGVPTSKDYDAEAKGKLYPEGDQMMIYSGQKLAPTILPPPSKFVYDKDEPEIKKPNRQTNTIDFLDEEFEYHIEQTIPDEIEKFYYKSFQIQDRLNPIYEFPKASDIVITDEKSTGDKADNIADLFTIKVSSSGVVTIKAKPTTLTDKTFYGNTFHIRFKTHVQPDADLSDYAESGKDGDFAFRNIATSYKDDVDVQKSEETVTRIKDLRKTQLKKFTVREKDNVNISTLNQLRDDGTMTYRIRAKLGNERKLDRIEFTDTLEDIWEIVPQNNKPALIANSSDSSADGYEAWSHKGEFTQSGNKITWVMDNAEGTAGSGNPANYTNKEVWMIVNVKLRDGADLSKYIDDETGKIVIPNTASLKLNKSDPTTYKSNKVLVEVKPVKASIDKFNITANGSDTKEIVELKSGDKHKYGLDYTIPNDKKMTHVILSDDLEDVLDVKSVKVYDEDNDDITAKGTVKIDDTSEKVTWTASKPNELAGKSVRMVVEAQMKEHADITKYTNSKKVVKIPNTSQMDIAYADLKDGTTPEKTQLISKPVYVTTPLVKAKSEKFNVDVDGRESTAPLKAELGQEVKYHLNFAVPNDGDVQTLKLTDDLEDVIDLNSVRVYDGDKDVTSKGKMNLNQNTESFEWTATNAKDFIGSQLKVVVQGKVKETADFSAYVTKNGTLDIPNVGNMVINGTPLPTPEVVVQVQQVDNKAEKFNINENGGRTTSDMNLAVGDRHRYELEFTVTNYKMLNSLELQDDLADAMDLKTVKIYADGDDVTDKGDLDINDTLEKFTWKAKKPSEFAGKKLVVKIESQLKKDFTFEDFYKDGKIVIPNKGLMLLNNGDKPEDKIPTPEVDVTTDAVKASVTKYHIDENERRHTDMVDINQGDSHEYELEYTIPNVQKTSSIVLRDDLENVLDLQGASVTMDGVDVTSKGDLKLDTEKELVEWTPKNPSDFAGKKLALRIQAKVKQGVNFLTYVDDKDNIIIPNVGELVLNKGTKPEDKIKSKEVDLQVKKVDDSAMKYNYNAAGGKTTDIIKVLSGKAHSYSLDFTVNNFKPIKKLVLQDDLENPLDLKSVVVMVDGKDVTAKGDLVLNDKTEKFTWTALNPMEFAGKKITVKVNATLKSDVTFDGFIKDGKATIPNVASMILDDKDEVKTPEVFIETPSIATVAKKWNINKKGVKVMDTMQVNDYELHTYQMDFKITNEKPFDGFKLTDDVEDALDLLDAKVYLDDKDITKEGTLNVVDDSETFSWIPNKPKAYVGKTLNVVLVVQMKHSKDLTPWLQKNGKIMIPNTGELTYYHDADEPLVVKTNPVDVTTPGIGNHIEKYNVAQKGAIVTDRQSVESEAAQVAWEQVANNYKDKDASINYDPETHVESEEQRNNEDVDAEATTLPDEEKHDVTGDFGVQDEINRDVQTVAGDRATGDGVYLKVPERESKEETLGEDGVLANAKIGKPTTNIVQLNPEQKHQYRFGFHIRNNEDIKKLIISDDLEDVWNFEGVHIMMGDTDITNLGALSLGNNDEKFTWTARNPSRFIGEDIVAIVDVKLKSNANFADYNYEGLYDIPNVGYLQVNDEKTMSNPVVVNTPGIETKADKYNIVNSKNTKDTVRVLKGKQHMYELDFRIQNTEKMDFLKIEDDIENVMDLSNVKVYQKGKEITSQGTLKVDNDEEHFTWTAHDPMAHSGQLITVKVTTKAKKNTDLSNYRKDEVPNTASIYINDEDPIDTNTVMVVPYETETPEKSDYIDPDGSVPKKVTDDPKKDVIPQEWDETPEIPDEPIDNGKIDQLVQTGAEHKGLLISILAAILAASTGGVAWLKRRRKKDNTSTDVQDSSNDSDSNDDDKK